jgi:ubiquinone/menaquinone biosynthesis C-methylase UbiE
MAKHKVNYEQIANKYNLRFEGEKENNISQKLISVIEKTQSRIILEVGCGTGHWLEAINAHPKPGKQLLGLDLSRGMLSQAHNSGKKLLLVQGKAKQLPFSEQSIDMVFCVNAIHHFKNPNQFIKEAKRVLKPGGNLAIIGTNPRNKEHTWYVYDYFPGTLERDLNRFPAWATITYWLIRSDFNQITLENIETINEKREGYAVLDDYFLMKHATSQLALLRDDEYNQGLSRIQEDLERHAKDGKTTAFISIIPLSLLMAQKPII